MKRHLCVTALFAVAVIPDWASACWPRWGMPSYEQPSYVPVYSAPVYGAPFSQPMYAQPIYLQPGVQMLPPLQPPRIEPSKSKPGNVRTEPARPIARPDPANPSWVPSVEPVRPAAGVDAPKPQTARPEPAPAPEPDKPKSGLFEIPKNPTPNTSIPPPAVPTGSVTEPNLPPLILPKTTNPKPPTIRVPNSPGAERKLPSLDLPGTVPAPVPAPASQGTAVPVPAPAPDILIPKNPNTLPPLTLPPDAPVAPPQPVEVKSSPLNAARQLTITVFPAAGAGATSGLRKIGFYNHTKRDLALTIEGKAVTLPAMSYLYAQLPPTFTWKCADQPAAKASVPADARGLDVLIRE